MFGIVIAVHVVACALLILIVLVQQGRGGGLIDSLSSAENIFGTKTSTFLVKATSILAVIFFFTCLSLAFLSIRKGKSLIETSYRPGTAATQTSTAAPAAPSTPAPAVPTTPTAPATSPQTSTANVETKK
jgi:preprotein translocase subunit SecG